VLKNRKPKQIIYVTCPMVLGGKHAFRIFLKYESNFSRIQKITYEENNSTSTDF